MNICNKLIFSDLKEIQNEDDLSFIGGRPRVPNEIEIPTCKLCGSKQTFFFQVAFTEKQPWDGYTMAVFACTSCVHKDYFIPEMLKGRLKDIDIPNGFLDEYQKNFRILVFETSKGRVRKNYEEKIIFKKWVQERSKNPKVSCNKIGGTPNWYLGDESPSTYNKTTEMIFLMQLKQEFDFDILPYAPQQVDLGLTLKIEPMNKPYYRLFLKNYTYFLGTRDINNPKVYIITQI
ncbi:MAG: hypothetical protein Q8936_22345 [Bacillota bacterium]|nr:hypothetical protein [Bacillota bacterium]